MIYNGAVAEAERIPTDRNLRIIDPNEASRLFGNSADRLDGVTVCQFALNVYFCRLLWIFVVVGLRS